ncbi:hypothetical protein [Jannaschia sp. R86511]|uniref:hypothetical protein n=1 Tax=Jannaschia sp. R86511 TaxID=3093853 RepID=UPI0036D23061
MHASRARRPLALAAAAAVGLSLSLAPAASAAPDRDGRVTAQGPLEDLSAAADPTDGATATVLARQVGRGGSVVVLRVAGLRPNASGLTLGAHVHEGPCVADDGAAAGPHWRTSPDVAPSPDTEVWLDVTPGAGGRATAVAVVPFQIPAGSAQSVVVHAMPTAPDGGAGARLACLPVDF